MVASASRDQTIRVFDIRAMKEFRVLKGHKKEVCCELTSSMPIMRAKTSCSIAVAWHPVHPILVSGGSEGAIMHWDLSASEPSLIQPTSQPRATLSQAHDSNVWSLAYHPLGHLLVSASNDHTTRFWSRERPGDSTSVFSGGGEKPPEIIDTAGQEDDDDAMPGFVGGWYGKEEEADGSTMRPTENGYARGPYSESTGGGMTEDFIPGFGAAENSSSVVGRQSGPLPSQEDMLRVTGNEPQWGRGGDRGQGGGPGGGPSRQSRWGPRGGGGGGGGRY